MTLEDVIEEAKRIYIYKSNNLEDEGSLFEGIEAEDEIDMDDFLADW